MTLQMLAKKTRSINKWRLGVPNIMTKTRSLITITMITAQSRHNERYADRYADMLYIDRLMQERRNSSALAMVFLALTHWYMYPKKVLN